MERICSRLRTVGELLDEARLKYRNPNLPDVDSAALMDRLERYMTRWGAWGRGPFGYYGELRTDPEAKSGYGMAFREIGSWAKVTKYQHETVRGTDYWVRDAASPAIKLTLEDGDGGLRFIQVTFIPPDYGEAQNLLSHVGERTDRIVVDWESDAAKLRTWFGRIGMRHSRVSVSGLRPKADRFHADMDDAKLQKLLGVVTRFTERQEGLQKTTREQRGEREFVRSEFWRWERPKREVGIVVRADQYNQKNKDRRGGKGFSVAVLMWPIGLE